MIDRRPNIIDVQRKPSKCPVCGEHVVDIIYGTGDMTEIEFLFQYRREGMMGGDNIPRNPPIWECCCGCRRFRKVEADGTPSPVKVKLLKNVRKKPATLINWESNMVEPTIEAGLHDVLEHYLVKVTTELGEEETLSVTAYNNYDAVETAKDIVNKGAAGLKGTFCISAEIVKTEK